MIQVKIASSLDEAGIVGARWVLVDPSASREPPAERVAGGRREIGASRRALWLLRLVSGVLLTAALAAAWWVALAVLDARRASEAHAASVASARGAGGAPGQGSKR